MRDPQVTKGFNTDLGFLNWMVSFMENPTKMDDLGVAPFSERSKSTGHMFFKGVFGSCHPLRQIRSYLNIIKFRKVALSARVDQGP